MSFRVSHPKFDEVRRITQLYIVALSVIAALSLLGQVLIQRQLIQQHADAKVINVAGRQRMLSQRLSKCVVMLAAQPVGTESDLVAVREELRGTLEQWRRSHQGLKSGDVELGLPGRLSPEAMELFQEVDRHFHPLYEAARPLLTEDQRLGSYRELVAIREQETKFLDGMDALVSQLELEAKMRVERLQSLEWFLLACMLMALTFEGLFIFRPAVRRIQSTIETIRRVSNDLNQAKVAAESASRAKSQFLAKVSHELRTPLHAVRGATDLLLLRESDERSLEYLQMADEAAHSLSLLVEDLLDLSQIESDTLKLRHEPFELHRTLQRVVRMVRPQAQRNNLPIRLECSPRLPLWVVGDEFRLQQVLLNLLVNAVKFTHAGEIRLRATSADEPVIELMPYSGQTANGVIFEVMDTGVGIPEESQQLIFEKFTQLSPTAHEGTSGIGLGLSIAAQLVGLMNGHISVTSRVGKGSVFSVFLPLSSASASASEVNGDHTTAKSILSSREEVQEPSCLNEANLFPPIASEDVRSEHYDQTANRRLRVLVADDTLVSRQVIQAMLASLGHEAKAVGDGMQALEAFLHTTYDAVLLDMQMPEWNGVRTAQELRKAERSAGRCRTPLLMLSATTERHGAGSDLFDAQLTKPVSLNVLQATLSRITAALQVNEGACQEDVLPSGTALQRMGGNRALFEEIYQAFFDQLPEQLRELRVAVEGQTDQVPVVAHRLSGQLLMLDFYEAAAVARSMEDVASRRHDIADASIQELLAHFESLLRQLPSPSF